MKRGSMLLLTLGTICSFLGSIIMAQPARSEAEACVGYQLAAENAAAIPSIVSGQPSGTTFCFAAGSYRMTAKIKPKDGDKFIGAGMGVTTLKGAKALSGWTLSDGLWVHTGDVVSMTKGGTCFEGTACRYPDWLFKDGVTLTRVLSPCTTSNVTTGKFCIDYGTLKVQVKDDPTGHSMEYAWVDRAFNGGKNVTVSSMSIKMFANADDTGAVLITGENWVVTSVEMSKNHACAISASGSHALIQAGHFHHNGQAGFCGAGSTGPQIVDNEVDHNNTLGYDGDWGGGGGKLSKVVDPVVTGNNIHDNDGNGLWLDDDAIGALISGNISSNNTDIYGGGDGVKIEKSCQSTIEANTLSGNSRDGIHINNSQDNVIVGNTITVLDSGEYGIRMNTGPSGAGDGIHCGANSREITVDNTATGNDITMPANASTWNGVVKATGAGETTGNAFLLNAYHMLGDDCGDNRWKWWDGGSNEKVDFGAWKGFDQDLVGTCD